MNDFLFAIQKSVALVLSQLIINNSHTEGNGNIPFDKVLGNGHGLHAKLALRRMTFAEISSEVSTLKKSGINNNQITK